MKLTPLDIRHKEFKRGMRGYVDGEVDEFLDEVADEFERLFKENIELVRARREPCRRSSTSTATSKRRCRTRWSPPSAAPRSSRPTPKKRLSSC